MGNTNAQILFNYRDNMIGIKQTSDPQDVNCTNKTTYIGFFKGIDRNNAILFHGYQIDPHQNHQNGNVYYKNAVESSYNIEFNDDQPLKSFITKKPTCTIDSNECVNEYLWGKNINSKIYYNYNVKYNKLKYGYFIGEYDGIIFNEGFFVSKNLIEYGTFDVNLCLIKGIRIFNDGTCISGNFASQIELKTENNQSIYDNKLNCFKGDDLCDNDTNDEIKLNECVVCFENCANSAFIKCGHVSTCFECSKSCEICPICRKESKAIKLYFS